MITAGKATFANLLLIQIILLLDQSLNLLVQSLTLNGDLLCDWSTHELEANKQRQGWLYYQSLATFDNEIPRLAARSPTRS